MKLEDAKQVTLRLKIPSDAHPATLAGNGPSADTGRAALASLYGALGTLLDAEPKVPVEAQPELVGPARDLATRTIKSAAKAIDTLTGQQDHYQKQITAALTPKVSDVVQSEIRAHFKSRGKDAFTEIMGLLRAGNPAALPVLSGPAFLSGLTDEQLGVLRTHAETSFAPDATAGRAEAEAALAKVKKETERFTATAGEKLKKWDRGRNVKAADIFGGA